MNSPTPHKFTFGNFEEVIKTCGFIEDSIFCEKNPGHIDFWYLEEKVLLDLEIKNQETLLSMQIITGKKVNLAK